MFLRRAREEQNKWDLRTLMFLGKAREEQKSGETWEEKEKGDG